MKRKKKLGKCYFCRKPKPTLIFIAKESGKDAILNLMVPVCRECIGKAFDKLEEEIRS